MQLSWLPSQSRHRSWVNDCICRRQQQLEVTQKQNMLLIPATCNGQICRRRIKYACEAGAKSKESPLDPEQHKVRRRDDFHEKQQKKAACYKFCDSIWNRNTNTTGHGRMRKRYLVMDFLPVRWMRLTFCGQPAAPLQTQLEILTLPPHIHTHHSRWYFNFSASLTDERTDRQSDWTDRQTDRRTALLSAELGRRVVDCFAMISLRNRKHQMRQIVRLQKDVLWNAPHSLTYLFLYSSAYLKFHCGLKAQYMYSESYSSSPCDLECID